MGDVTIILRMGTAGKISTKGNGLGAWCLPAGGPQPEAAASRPIHSASSGVTASHQSPHAPDVQPGLSSTNAGGCTAVLPRARECAAGKIHGRDMASTCRIGPMVRAGVDRLAPKKADHTRNCQAQLDSPTGLRTRRGRCLTAGTPSGQSTESRGPWCRKRVVEGTVAPRRRPRPAAGRKTGTGATRVNDPSVPLSMDPGSIPGASTILQARAPVTPTRPAAARPVLVPGGPRLRTGNESRPDHD